MTITGGKYNNRREPTTKPLAMKLFTEACHSSSIINGLLNSGSVQSFVTMVIVNASSSAVSAINYFVLR